MGRLVSAVVPGWLNERAEKQGSIRPSGNLVDELVGGFIFRKMRVVSSTGRELRIVQCSLGNKDRSREMANGSKNS